MGLLQRFDCTLDDVFKLRIEKKVEVRVWRVGLTLRLCQLAIITYIVLSLYFFGTWALSEVPVGSVNAWAEGGAWKDHANHLNPAASLDHCSGNSSFSFVYSPTFSYENPVCEIMPPFDMTSKLPNGVVSFTTVFIETSQVGWPCSDAVADATERAACITRGGNFGAGTVTGGSIGNQCVCTVKRTIYPLGVDLMDMHFEHSVGAALRDSSFAPLASSSNLAGTGPGTLPSMIHAADGTTEAFPSGSSISMSLQDWLQTAGVRLDDVNSIVSPDVYDSTKYPRIRTTGVIVEVNIEYSNLDPETRKAGWYNEQVFAAVHPTARANTWAGDGPVTVWNQYPTGAVGGKYFDKVETYRQGVIFKFYATGRLYRFDWFYLLSSLVNALVLLGSANTVAVMYAQFLAPDAMLIKNSTREQFKYEQHLAEIGMKAALTVGSFVQLDSSSDGQLDMEELVEAFARIPGMSFEQAFAISHLILTSADGQKGMKSKSASQKKSPRKVRGAKDQVHPMAGAPAAEAKGMVDFGEFMVAMESGNMVSWQEYLDVVVAKEQATPNTAADRAACRMCFNESRARQWQEAERANEETPNRSLSLDAGPPAPAAEFTPSKSRPSEECMSAAPRPERSDKSKAADFFNLPTSSTPGKPMLAPLPDAQLRVVTETGRSRVPDVGTPSAPAPSVAAEREPNPGL